MNAGSVWRPLSLIALAGAGLAVGGLAVNAGATRAVALTTTPKLAPACKLGQKSTTAHPCRVVPKCKPGQKSSTTHPCTSTKPATSTTSTTSTTSSTKTTTTSKSTTPTPPPAGGSVVTSPAGSTSGIQQNQPDGCSPGQSIPQGTYDGDGDEDNAGGPDDGDGCL